ncbi:cytochrome P450 [Metarhizium robertsii]|uniref:Cytochrome P450 CYP629C1 n=2 Tax=Metarhizium robertsii TaxID=568076 RepID=E9FBL0_METRA|nr:Cytochrome P450 CYP629C1 [Metarhizium robertsii ARSEF 23]EFY94948.2 Cytochrome P450 CYP629C1 [Metarhizium robertsii ARSEF 23]EXV01937.1 cytochrome P450 [Metarhizium robertsii]
MDWVLLGAGRWCSSILVLTALVLVATAVLRRYFSAISDVPGPFWASITRLWHIYYIYNGDHNTRVMELHEKHGHFVRIAPNEVSISHPDGPDLLLQKPLRKGDWYRVFTIPDYTYATPQSTLDPKEKMERSRMFAPGFTLSYLLRSEAHFDVNMTHLFDWMDKYAKTHEPTHLDKFFSYVTFDNAGDAIFSRSFGFTKAGQDIGGSIANSRSLNCYMAIAGYHVWIHRLFVANPIITWSGLLPMGHLFKTSMEALRQRKKDPDARFDIVAHWLKAHHERPDLLSYRDVEAQTTTSIAAASDTLSCALQSFVYFMMKHPNVWQRAKNETKTAISLGRLRDRIVSYRDSRKLPYLEACVYESLRMFGPTPFQLSRVAPKGGINIGSMYFPEGTVLSINPQVLQKSDDCWGPDANEFRPERWLPNGFQKKYRHWLVFGMGYNRCPGEHLAEIQIFKIAATIVRDYTIRAVDPLSEWKWKAYFTTVPHSWPVYIERK